MEQQAPDSWDAFHVIAFGTQEAAEDAVADFVAMGLPADQVGLFVEGGRDGGMDIPHSAACAAGRHVAAGRAVVLVSERRRSSAIALAVRCQEGLVASVSSFEMPAGGKTTELR